MIKLLQAKEDIYWEDSLPDQKPFCKKGGWYEVISSSKVDLQFKNEEGMTHIWSLSDLDEDFWTVDFDKGFEFLPAMNVPYYMKNNNVFSKDEPDNKILYTEKTISMACDSIKQGGWTITRFSNQPEQPSVEERPFENWKKDIGKGWHFVRENKDSSLVKAYTPEAKGMVAKEDVLASFSVPVDNKDIEQQESSKGEVEVYSAEASVWSDKHYDFTYTLTEEDIGAGEIKIDPYFVADQWKLGEKDNSGVIFHILKTCSRYKCKHKEEREIKAIYGQIKRLAEMRGVTL